MIELTSAELAAKAMACVDGRPFRGLEDALVYATLSHAAAVREQTEELKRQWKMATS